MSVAALIGVVSVDAADIVALARDPRRHAFLLRSTGSDYAAQAGDPGRARDLLALALSADSPEIVWWMEALTECFPDVVRHTGHMFLTALVPGGSAEQFAGDD